MCLNLIWVILLSFIIFVRLSFSESKKGGCGNFDYVIVFDLNLFLNYVQEVQKKIRTHLKNNNPKQP